jgi:hypothetical protein
MYKKLCKSIKNAQKTGSWVGTRQNAKKCGFLTVFCQKNSIFLYAADPFAKNGLAVHTPGGRGSKKSIFLTFFVFFS